MSVSHTTQRVILLFSVRRRSSESKKPRSPSQRRIGVIRRRSREREAAAAAAAARNGERRSRSPGPRRSPRSPATPPAGVFPLTTPAAKPALTPLKLDRPLVLVKGGSRLQRGQPNSTTSGLEKPSPVVAVALGVDGQTRPRIKMSFNSKVRPPLAVPGSTTRSAVESGARVTSTPPTKKAISHSDSIASLR